MFAAVRQHPRHELVHLGTQHKILSRGANSQLAGHSPAGGVNSALCDVTQGCVRMELVKCCSREETLLNQMWIQCESSVRR